MKNKKGNKKKIFYNSVIIFNILLIVGLIAYYGYRLVYYYKLEHQPPKELKYLSEKITSGNQLVNEGDGLYLDEDSKTFYFKGVNVNNYLYYSGNMWRIIKVNKDGSMVLILNQPITSITYGTNSQYQTSSVHSYLNKIENQPYTGLFEQVLNHPDSYLKKTAICTDVIANVEDITCEKTNNQDLVGILNLSDYELSGGKNGYLNNGVSYYTATRDNYDRIYYVHSKGGVSLADDYSEHNYGVRPTITLKSKINYLSGDGSENNPYIIEEKEQIPTIQVGNYVNYSGYTWKVISKNDSTYKLATTTLLTDANGQVYTRSYGNRTSEYNPKTYGSLAYYLNRTWYRTLDSSLIVDGVWNIGNYQVEGITDYKNIYTNTVTAKVGLLSVGEMYSLELPNTWLLTSLNEEDGMVYTVQEGNKYFSDIIDSEYGIRPAIYITNQVKIISGSGVLSDPYVIGGM